MGTYRKDAAGHIHILAQRREMQQIKNQFNNESEFIAHLKAHPLPGTLNLRIKHLTHQPRDWDHDLFGDFPQDGLLAVYCRIPSSNKSATNSLNDKHTCIFFSNQPNTKLQLKFELKSVFGWFCFSRSADNCNRLMSCGRHVMGALTMIVCPNYTKDHMVCPMPVMDAREPDFMQPKVLSTEEIISEV